MLADEDDSRKQRRLKLINIQIFIYFWLCQWGGGGYAPYLVELEKEIWLKNNILKWDWFKFWRLHETHEQSTATP